MNKSFARNSDELLNLFCENNTKLELDVVQDENSILNLDFTWKSMLVIGDFLQLPSSSFEHVTLIHGACWNFTSLLRLFIKIVIPNLQNYWTECVLVSKLNLILQPYMPLQILIFLNGLKTFSDYIWRIIWLITEIWKWWIMRPTQSLQLMLLMEKQIVTQVLFSVIWVMILISQRQETWKKILIFVLVLECNWLVMWMLKISYVLL